MIIRTACLSDAIKIAEAEEICFGDESIPLNWIEEMIKDHPEYIYIMEEDKLIGYVLGVRSDENEFNDDMFSDPGSHKADGLNFFLTGLAIMPEYRDKGYSAELMEHVIKQMQEKGIKEIILTCHDYLAPYYSKFGFINTGKAPSSFAGKKWQQMKKHL